MKQLTTWSLMLTLMIAISCTREDTLISSPDNALDPLNDVESVSNARAAVSGVRVPVFNAVMGGETGTATIKKNNKGFTVNFKVSDLIQGHTYTLWCVAWNKPENCSTPNECSDVDIAELHFVLRSHGPAIPGLVNEQINSYEGGCTTFFDPFTKIPMNKGECGDFLFSIFAPGC
jgi:hypothetical protein